LNEIDEVPTELKNSVSDFMSYVHVSVNNKSNEYRENDRRHNYTTPKSFLEQIKLYEGLLKTKRQELLAKMERLENGLQKLQSTAAQVDDLKAKLASQEDELKHFEKEATGKLIAQVEIESADAQKEQDIANTQAEETNKVANEAQETKAGANKELEAAIPAMKAAEAAVACLEIKAI
jgi:dynein heavy chain